MRKRPVRKIYTVPMTILMAISMLMVPSLATAKNNTEMQLNDNGPVGWDVYRHLERLPELASGTKTRQFSSYDRSGGNNDGFEGTYSCLSQSAVGCVIAESSGPGEIESIWFTRGGDLSATGKIRIELDGNHIIDASLKDLVEGKLGAPFVYPLVASYSESSGGVVVKVPMPYRQSMRITTQNNPFFYHVTYRNFSSAEGIKTFDPNDRAEDVIELLRSAGQRDPKPIVSGTKTTNKQFELAPGEQVTLAKLNGPGAINELRLRLPEVIGSKIKDFTDDGRAFGKNGYSEFRISIDPNNEGVRLIRRVDQKIGNQRARVLVDGVEAGEWKPIPPKDGQWFDQAVELPKSVTGGKSSVVIRNEFISSDLDFNEFAYWADSHVGEQLKRTDTLDVGPSHKTNEHEHAYSIKAQTWEGTNTARYPAETLDPQEAARIAASDEILRDTRIQISFDGRNTVDAPIGEFFGSGLGEYPVRSLFFAMDTSEDGWYSAWWLMPYRETAAVTLINHSSQTIRSADAEVASAPGHQWAKELSPHGNSGYFTALSRSEDVADGKDYIFADISGRGKFVGVSHTMNGKITSGNTRNYLEGDERVYVDGAKTPQIYGTGTEDFYESGWYFSYGTYSNPMTGNTGHERNGLGCTYECDSVYRLFIGDAISYLNHLRFGIEHGPVSNEPALYSSTAYMYAQPNYGLLRTDTLDVGDKASETSHQYFEESVSTPVNLTSVYEGDDDHIQVSGIGRTTTGAVEFQLLIDKQNDGVRLQRTSDQKDRSQAAQVYIDGKPAGRWFQPLGNDKQRWLDDSFELPAALTSGKKAIKVRIVPEDGAPAWHAAEYIAYSRVKPSDDRKSPYEVTGLSAESGETNEIRVSWQPANDNVGVAHYQVYASRENGFTPGPETLLGETTVTGITYKAGLRETWRFRVAAVDYEGNTGGASAEVQATTGSKLIIEAEALLPALESRASFVTAQGNCCGVTWSGDKQLWLFGMQPGDYATVAFTVPQDGLYDLAAVLTKARDYGVVQLSIDGQNIGEAFDGFNPTVVKSDPINLGKLQLKSGQHSLTLKVTGKSASSTGYLAGIDILSLLLND
ncbi:DUF2961 domain-containing protein [Paenibacillus sedimenti]|uniref:DUF2961 domain-containing protein n=1 Tax=Paenibacillus sedimenti TaxID=2770274 RepID=A0A926KJA4_9BACL|nr:DUF2961 domain-containing protein [Paenibacillus sedimenti]MBD0378782.1 DUF2961 domain-containing protein [Paenibacillus sedimenti]